MEFKCAECSKLLEEEVPILVDGRGLPPLDFCSWDCLMRYAVKIVNSQHDTFQSEDGSFSFSASH